MPVHAAGPRLFSKLKFRHLVKKTGSGAGVRESNVSLNLVPFVDMMTILVCFLLMVFSAEGALLQAKPGLELPVATSKETLQAAPTIQVGKDEITLVHGRKGLQVATVAEVINDPGFNIQKLYDSLEAAGKEIKSNILDGKNYAKRLIQACEDQKSGIRPKIGEACPDGLAILQADEGTDVRVINKVVYTARAAGFYNLLFAVKNK